MVMMSDEDIVHGASKQIHQDVHPTHQLADFCWGCFWPDMIAREKI